MGVVDVFLVNIGTIWTPRTHHRPRKIQRRTWRKVLRDSRNGRLLVRLCRKRMESFARKASKITACQKEARSFVRFFYSAATECILDKQGRINLPKTLCDYAELVKPCVFIGVSNRIEIWSEQRWEKASEQAAASFDDMAEDLLDFGL